MNNHLLGIIYLDEAGSGLTHDFFSVILNGFKLQAEEEGYEVLFINTNPIGKINRNYLEHIKNRGIDGVGAICMNINDAEVRRVIESDLPIVTIDEAMEGKCAVLSDNSQGIRNLAYYIAEQGHKKIAYIHGDVNTVTNLRIQNFKDACAEMGISVPDEYIRPSKYRDLDKTAYETEELLRLPDPPTCIIFPDDYAAIGGINILKARGLDIPRDISVAAYDGIEILSQIEPKLATIRQDMDGMGRAAAHKLIELIEHPDQAKIENISIGTTLDKGHTVGKRYF